MASVPDATIFKSGRELAAWIELVPRQTSTGGEERLGRISKQGDQYLRWLLVVGALAVIRQAKRRGATNPPWLADLIARNRLGPDPRIPSGPAGRKHRIDRPDT